MMNNANGNPQSNTAPTLGTVKTLGGIGSLLTILAVVPMVGVVLAIIGLILVLVALKYASDALNDSKIFNNMLYAVILGIVGIAVGFVAVAAIVFKSIGLGYLPGSFAYIGTSAPAVGDVASIIGTVLLGLAAIWACFLASSIFLRRSYGELGRRLNVSLFGTAGLIYLIGSALTIVLVGFPIIFVAGILFMAAFFEINPRVTTIDSGLVGSGSISMSVGPTEYEGMGWRVPVSVVAAFGSLITAILWLVFFASGFSIYQNIAAVAVIFLVFIGVMGATWASWGMRYSERTHQK